MSNKLYVAALLAAFGAATASASPITGSFSLGLSSGSYVGPAGATAANATGLDFGYNALSGGTGTGNGFGTNGTGVVFNSKGDFAGLDGSTVSVADLAFTGTGSSTVANAYYLTSSSSNNFLQLGSYFFNFTNAVVTRSSTGTSVTVAGTGTFTDGILADASTGNFSLSANSQGGLPGAIDFTFTGNSSASGTAVTPEPNSLALLGTGLLSLAGMARKRFA